MKVFEVLVNWKNDFDLELKVLECGGRLGRKAIINEAMNCIYLK